MGPRTLSSTASYRQVGTCVFSSRAAAAILAHSACSAGRDNVLINQLDLDGLLRRAQRKLRLVKVRRTHLFLWIIGSAVALLRDSEETLVELSVHILVVEHRDCVSSLRNIAEDHLGAHRLAIDVRELAAKRRGCALWKTFRTLKQRYTDFALRVSHANHLDCQCALCWLRCSGARQNR